MVGRGVAGLDDVELARSAASCPAGVPPAQVVPGGVGAQRRDEDLVGAGAVDVQERLLADRPGSAPTVVYGGLGKLLAGAPCVADEDHVPVGAGPAAHWRVARQPLLLRAGADLAVDLGVGDEAAAGPAAVVQLRGCRGRASGGTAPPARPPSGRCRRTGLTDRFSAERQKFWVALPWNQSASACTAPLMVTSSGDRPRPGDLGVEADVGVDVVGARLEQQGVALACRTGWSPAG